jgi:hypothetical protein
LEDGLSDPDLVEKLMAARRLGGYIKTSFKGWYDDAEADFFTGSLDAVCRGEDLHFAARVADWVPVSVDHLRETFGEALLSVEQVPEEGGICVKAEITERAKIAHLLTHATGTKVSPDAVPEYVDGSSVNQVIQMINDDSWAQGLREAKNPLHHFLTYREEVEIEDEHEEADAA